MKKLFLLACGILCTVSCTKNSVSTESDVMPAIKIQLSQAEQERLPLLSDNHQRTPETVLAFAQHFAQTLQPESKVGSASFSICDSVSLSDAAMTKAAELDVAPLYIVSRGSGEGFVLVAGDNRMTPVWGMIEKGDYAEGINPGFDIMMEQLKEEMLLEVLAVESLRDSVYDNLRAKMGLASWQTKIPPTDPLPNPGFPDPSEYNRTETVERYPYYEIEYEHGPLLKTKWGQRWPYDTEVVKTHAGCPVGCVAVAMAQIMAYHKYPTYFSPTGHTYLWDQFGMIYTDYDKWTSDAIASVGYLMADLGLPRYLDITYGSDGSSAERQKIVGAFNAFGYACGSLTDYSVSKITEEVKNNRPVYICGGKSKGHAWVTDGTLYQNQWVTICIQFYWNDHLICEVEGTEPTKKSSGSYIHHNFGWNGLDNGWLARLDPIYIYRAGIDASTFNTNVKISTGIQPK